MRFPPSGNAIIDVCARGVWAACEPGGEGGSGWTEVISAFGCHRTHGALRAMGDSDECEYDLNGCHDASLRCGAAEGWTTSAHRGAAGGFLAGSQSHTRRGWANRIATAGGASASARVSGKVGAGGVDAHVEELAARTACRT